MKRNNNIITETFEVGVENFCVDIVADNDEKTYNAWLYRKDIGVKMHMFGVKQSDYTYFNFVRRASLITKSDMELYDEDYNY